ncbi:DUF4136 domain-containing protein [Noviherbaspirillum massiliense]|uniref:DUF4136 domain-containing protein n=1 Tax=Noviherbaspirillum massiliense TaxID=1465823 RepID=UPI000307A766|nr:DUF4136 domain-containing protein [Noviherbaspirillum massiliense]
MKTPFALFVVTASGAPHPHTRVQHGKPGKLMQKLEEAVRKTRSLLALPLVALSLALGGCATTISSTVTPFHDTPFNLQDKTYTFERSKEQQNSLEYKSYENLVRTELNRLGFEEAEYAGAAALKAAMNFDIRARDVRISEPVVVDPYWYGMPAWPGYYGPFYRPFYSPFYSPFYDPFWYGPPIVERRESSYVLYTRRLKFSLARTGDGRKVYETTVVSEGTNGSLAAVMPYMVRSAFADFPGESGVPRVVELKMKE